MSETDTALPESETIELLTFHAGGQEYALDIMSVREIRGWTQVTPLPHAAPFVRGVVNLRGTVLTIVDLAERLGLGQGEAAKRTVIIVVQAEGEALGLMVDAVSDIIEVARSALQNPPDLSADGGARFVSALTICDERMIRVLDLSETLPGGTSRAA